LRANYSPKFGGTKKCVISGVNLCFRKSPEKMELLKNNLKGPLKCPLKKWLRSCLKKLIQEEEEELGFFLTSKASNQKRGNNNFP